MEVAGIGPFIIGAWMLSWTFIIDRSSASASRRFKGLTLTFIISYLEYRVELVRKIIDQFATYTLSVHDKVLNVRLAAVAYCLIFDRLHAYAEVARLLQLRWYWWTVPSILDHPLQLLDFLYLILHHLLIYQLLRFHFLYLFALLINLLCLFL